VDFRFSGVNSVVKVFDWSEYLDLVPYVTMRRLQNFENIFSFDFFYFFFIFF